MREGQSKGISACLCPCFPCGFLYFLIQAVQIRALFMDSIEDSYSVITTQIQILQPGQITLSLCSFDDRFNKRILYMGRDFHRSCGMTGKGVTGQLPSFVPIPSSNIHRNPYRFLNHFSSGVPPNFLQLCTCCFIPSTSSTP